MENVHFYFPLFGHFYIDIYKHVDIRLCALFLRFFKKSPDDQAERRGK